jgi:hypothetical protein
VIVARLLCVRMSYSFLNNAELLELCAQSDVVSVPGKAAVDMTLAQIHSRIFRQSLPNEKLRHDD